MEEKKQLIYEAMLGVMSEIGAVEKNKKNEMQGYKFRGIDDMLNALHPLLIKYGVFIIPRCKEERSEMKEVTRSNGKAGIDKHVAITMEYDFTARDGSKITIGGIPSEGLDSSDKATNKALSAAMKYCLIQTFCVPTEDMADADKTTPEILPKHKEPEKKAAPARLNKGNVEKAVEAFRKAQNIEELEKLQKMSASRDWTHEELDTITDAYLLRRGEINGAK